MSAVAGSPNATRSRPCTAPTCLSIRSAGSAIVHETVDGLKTEQLAFQIDPDANSIAWLVWHLTRIQDDHVADAAQTEQVWTSKAGSSGSPCRSAVWPRAPRR